MNASKHIMPTNGTDPGDVPELTDAFFEQADEYTGSKLVRRGRPISENHKISLTLRYDSEVVEAFKATGKGWQTRMNAALKEWLRGHPQKLKLSS